MPRHTRERFADFVSRLFLPVGLYDVLPLRPFTEAIALAEGRPYDESVRDRARTIAQRDIGGLYKLLLRAVSPMTTLDRLPRVAQRYFDFGVASTRPLVIAARRWPIRECRA